MTTNNTNISEADAGPASVLLGQTRGAMVLIGAGLGWVMLGLSALGDLPLGFLLAVFVAPALLFLGGLAVRRMAPGLRDAEWSPGMRRAFQWAVAGETIAILAVCAVALSMRRPEWIFPLGGLAVGLHFFPLARAFQRPLQNLTGATLCLICLATLALPPDLGVPHLRGWRLVTGLGGGLTLWLTALVMLAQRRAGLRKLIRPRHGAS